MTYQKTISDMQTEQQKGRQSQALTAKLIPRPERVRGDWLFKCADHQHQQRHRKQQRQHSTR
jgi:hypothetical protein